MEVKFSILLFIITFADIYFNYYSNEFPEYHKARLYSDFLTLICIFSPVFLVLFICSIGIFLYFQLIDNNMVQKCTFYVTVICVLSVIIFALISSVIQLYSIYIYFAYDGSSKIQNKIIKVLMWISFINIIIKIFFAFCDFISSLKKPINENNEENEKMVELEEQDRI